jgi:predicted Holliday junction resolvase-like endonuclease
MEPETLLLLALVVILIEYVLRLKGRVNKLAEEKFEEWKKRYLAEKEETTIEKEIKEDGL